MFPSMKVILSDYFKVTMEQDMISIFIERPSFHHILINILIHLDTESLASVACCCRLWAGFMRTQVRGSQVFRDRRLELHWATRSPTSWIISCGTFVSCMAWDKEAVVVGRGQSATYTAAVTGHTTMISPLVFVYSRPQLEKIHSLYGHKYKTIIILSC